MAVITTKKDAQKCYYPSEYIGLSADTTAFLAATLTCDPGSTYMELDGSKRLYMFNGTAWYQL